MQFPVLEASFKELSQTFLRSDNMTTSKRLSKPRSRISSRSPDAAKALILDVNNIQGRHLRSVLPVNIRNIRTVRQLKKAIATHHNLTVRELLYRGVSVRDDRQLAHLLPTMTKIGHSPRFSVRTSFIPSPKPGDMILFVKSLTGKTLEVHLPPQSTVGDLKDAVEDVGGIPVSESRLCTPGCHLWEFEDDLPLASLNLVSGSVLYSFLRLRGGGLQLPFQSFVDMEKTSSLKTCELGDPDTTRPWRNVVRGLNIRGKCQNLKCKAYGCDVYCQKGFTVFNIAEPVTCPSCEEKFTAVTCGFWGCEWMFEGRKLMSGVDIMSRWNVTGDEEFQWFDDRGGRNTTDWSSLVITVKSLNSFGSFHGKYEDCVLCFGSLHVSNPQSGITKNGTCGHAVHAVCARAFVRAGYSNCPTCRLPLGSGTQE